MKGAIKWPAQDFSLGDTLQNALREEVDENQTYYWQDS